MADIGGFLVAVTDEGDRNTGGFKGGGIKGIGLCTDCHYYKVTVDLQLAVRRHCTHTRGCDLFHFCSDVDRNIMGFKVFLHGGQNGDAFADCKLPETFNPAVLVQMGCGRERTNGIDITNDNVAGTALCQAS